MLSHPDFKFYILEYMIILTVQISIEIVAKQEKPLALSLCG